MVAFKSDEDIALVFDLNIDLTDSASDTPFEPTDNDSVPTPIADTPLGLTPMLIADVMFAAVVCAEEAPNSKATASPDISSNFQQTTRDAINRILETMTYSDGSCSELGAPPANPIESQAVRSDLPALLLGDSCCPV